MQELRTATVLFCTGCICAELVMRLTGSGWARRCIKAVAGLYILVVLFHAVPRLRTELQGFSLPEVPSVSMGTLEELLQAELEVRGEEIRPEGGDPPA